MRLFRCAALAAALFTASAHAQMTPVTYTNLNIGGVPIPAGTITFLPVDDGGNQLPLVTSDGQVFGVGAIPATITNGTMSAVSLPDQLTSIALNPNSSISYTVTVTRTSTGGGSFSFKIPAASGFITGTNTVSLNAFTPPQIVQVYPSALGSGTALPAGSKCNGAGYFYTYSGTTVTGQYLCVAGMLRQVTTGSSGSGINGRGAYASGTTYVVGDIVSLNGSSYIAIQTSSGLNQQNPATATSYWVLLAAAGANGTNGTNGSNGTNGTNGAPGAAATVAVGTVSTGAAGSQAAVTNGGSSSAAVLNFTIPQGIAGQTGLTGPPGTYVHDETRMIYSALCSGGAASPAQLGTYATNPPGLGCADQGASTSPLGYMAFYSTDTAARYAIGTFYAPANFSSADLSIAWTTAATTGSATWSVATACVSPSGSTSTLTYGTPVTVTSAASSTARGLVYSTTLSAIAATGVNSCAAGSLVTYTISRGLSDGLSGEADLVGAVLTVHRS